MKKKIISRFIYFSGKQDIKRIFIVKIINFAALGSH